MTRRDVVKALGVWGTPESVPALVGVLRHEDIATRREAIAALGKIQGKQAAEAVAERLADFFDRSTARAALEAMGPVGEPAVLQQLQHPDESVRTEACRILKLIGTKDSMATNRAIPGPLRPAPVLAPSTHGREQTVMLYISGV